MILTYLKTLAASTCEIKPDEWSYPTIKDEPIKILVSNVACSLDRILFMLRNLVLFLGIMFIIIGGITLARSVGDPEKVVKGRETITWAILAILGAIFVLILLAIIAKFLGANTAINNGSVPTQIPDFKYNFNAPENTP